MDHVIEFIKINWKFIVLACCFLLEITLVLISIFTKKVKVNDALSNVLASLPSFINEAESTGLQGDQKLELVFRKCLELLHAATGLSVSTLMAQHGDFVLDAIENILSTPKKKEVNVDEKKNVEKRL